MKYLHAIRGFAALIVVIAHAKFPFWSGGQEYVKAFPRETWNVWDYFLFAVDMFSSNATVMVIVFFVLSGFFIAYSFDTNNWKLKEFYFNRGIRIYLPYIGSVILTLILFKSAMILNPELFQSINPREYNVDLIDAAEQFNIKALLWSLIFIPNPTYIGYNYPYWSLLIEAMFYIVAPFFIKRPKTFLFSSALLMVLGFLFRDQISTIISWAPLRNFLVVYSLFFAMGYFIYWLIFKYKVHHKISSINVWYVNFVALLLLVAAMYMGFLIDKKFTYILGGLFTCIMIYRIISYPINEGNIFTKFFVSMGKISYSMYLIHVPIFIFLYAILVKLTGQEVFYARIYWLPTIIAVLISYGFYKVVEAPSLQLIKKYKSYLKKKSNK